MLRFRSLAWVLLFLVPMVCLVSCGGDKKGTTQPPPGDEVPAIPAAEVTTDVEFGSNDPVAQQAESMVEGQLALAGAMASMGQAYMAPLGGADWQSAGSQCWTYSYGHAGCSWVYQVCRLALLYEWTLTLNGTCGGTAPYSNWVAMRGTTTADGHEGTMRVYEENSTAVHSAWAWLIAADNKSATWSFYDGDVHQDNLTALLEWVENPDGSEDVVWTWYESVRFETHVSASGNAGWMELYNWDAAESEWVLAWKIVWNADGSGYWAWYDDTGEEISRQTWSS
ncbi:MAG: hypothetical protein FJY75_00715 [Candidatus Eisenbacteria bacterium]|uniref:Uncharacterized protein n=1 Tax=Eiseniibacteriota bacterium TaxID=2212470 RepID=A0A938BPL9_UNCEI|nr:hypothetical protein [Candidatus Eisenbacteria bacterium]